MLGMLKSNGGTHVMNGGWMETKKPLGTPTLMVALVFDPLYHP